MWGKKCQNLSYVSKTEKAKQCGGPNKTGGGVDWNHCLALTTFFLYTFFFFLLHIKISMFKLNPQLYEKIKHFAKFPQTGVSLRQMVMFGKIKKKNKMVKNSIFSCVYSNKKVKSHLLLHFSKQVNSYMVLLYKLYFLDM